MRNLVYLILTALLTKILTDLLYYAFVRFIKPLLRKPLPVGPFLRLLWATVRQGWIGALLWLLGLITVLYVLLFGLLVLVGGTPTIDVPQQDIYVLDGQRGEARIVVLDKSFRGSLLNTFFPPADLMQVKITAKQGQVTVLDAIVSEPSHEVTVKAHHQQAVTLQYSLEPGYQMGHVQVSVFGFWDDPETDTAEAIKMIQFVVVRR
jgi:hypothetical protein